MNLNTYYIFMKHSTYEDDYEKPKLPLVRSGFQVSFKGSRGFEAALASSMLTGTDKVIAGRIVRYLPDRLIL